MAIKQYSNSRIDVFLMAFCLLFLESLYFKTVLFLHDYLNALFIVSYALTGLAIGALISSHDQRLSQNTILIIKLVLIFSILLSFINFVYFNLFLFLSPALILPFAVGNVLISYFFKQDNSFTIYFIDLLGATLGVIAIVFLIPIIREENCFILIMIILLASLVFNQPYKTKGFAVILILALMALGFLGYNLKYDPLNWVKIIPASPHGPKEKIYSGFQEFDLLYSRGSNIQRIDVLSPSYFGFNRENWPPMIYVAFNGLVNDVVRSEDHKGFSYRYDPRVIFGLIDKPDFLVIGTSAEGVVKTGAAHGGTVTGLEINPQIIDLMQGPLYKYSQKAYSLMDDVHEMDARTYLLQNDKEFDIITLMNSHMGRHSGLIGAPEFLHTREAVNTYMDHLTNQGFMVFEEKYYGDHGRISTMKIIHTILEALRFRGVENPKAHLYVYHWILNGLSILGDPEQPIVSHVMIVVKKQPLEPEDRFIINDWSNQVERYYGQTHEIMEIYPINEVSGTFTNSVFHFIQNYPEIKKPDFSPDSNKTDLSIITDNQPFPWSVDSEHTLVRSYLFKMGGIVLLLLIAILVYHRKNNNHPLIRSGFLLYTTYFALIGLGYFIIEIGLMNFYQIFMGSPAYAFVFILGTLLLSSGLGSYCFYFYKMKKTWWVFSGIFLLCAYHLFLGKYIMISAGAGPLHNSLVIAASVFPLGFVMGVPFPVGLEAVKNTYNRGHAAIFFAVNCLFSAFAVLLSFYLSLAFGFKTTFGMGMLLYFFAFAVLIPLVNKKTVNKKVGLLF